MLLRARSSIAVRSLAIVPIVVTACVTALSACSNDPPVDPEPPTRTIAIVTRDGERAAIRGFALLFPEDRVAVRVRPDPVAALADLEDEIAIALAPDLECAECYRIEVVSDARIVVHGDAPLGIQYGLAAVLEAM